LHADTFFDGREHEFVRDVEETCALRHGLEDADRRERARRVEGELVR